MKKYDYITIEKLKADSITLDQIANSNFTGWDNIIALAAGIICPMGTFTYGYVKGMCEVSSNMLKSQVKYMAKKGYGRVKITVDYSASSSYGTGNSNAIPGYQTATINSITYAYLP